MITTPPQNRSAGEREQLMFTCVATGNGAPNIMWIRQDGVELTGNTVSSGATTTSSILTISNIMSDDFTNYSCVAENTVSNNENIVAVDFANFTLYRAGKFVMYYVIMLHSIQAGRVKFFPHCPPSHMTCSHVHTHT